MQTKDGTNIIVFRHRSLRYQTLSVGLNVIKSIGACFLFCIYYVLIIKKEKQP